MSITKIKTNMKHLRRRIFQGKSCDKYKDRANDKNEKKIWSKSLRRMVFRDSLVTKTKTETTTNMTQKSQGEGFFRVRLGAWLCSPLIAHGQMGPGQQSTLIVPFKGKIDNSSWFIHSKEELMFYLHDLSFQWRNWCFVFVIYPFN